jgi:hypothetical protein
MISQPMGGKTDREIIETRERAMAALALNGMSVVNTIFDGAGDADANPLRYLGKSLEAMSRCDTVYFCKGWKQARGCRIEHEAALAYGLKIIYE